MSDSRIPARNAAIASVLGASIHRCHAMGCQIPVPRAMFMCKPHWYALPRPLRDAVWATYKPGQENRGDPSAEYIAVTARAIRFLAVKEHLLPAIAGDDVARP